MICINGFLKKYGFTLPTIPTTTNGYWMGGIATTSPTDNIDGISFSDETSNNPAIKLSSTRGLCSGVSSSTHGYAGSGSNDGNGIPNGGSISGIIFSTKAAFDTNVSMVTNRTTCCSMSGSLRGYWCGGIGSGGYSVFLNEIDGITYSSNTTVNPTATLVSARRNIASNVQSSIRGYSCGGYSGAPAFEIDGLMFSDETSINPAAVLKEGVYNLGGVSNQSKGYVYGGVGSTQTEIQYIDLSNESIVDVSSVLSSVMANNPSGVSSPTNGYIGGGVGTNSSEIIGIRYSDNTAINPSVVMADGGRYGCAAVNG